jgi:HSP20 family protein
MTMAEPSRDPVKSEGKAAPPAPSGVWAPFDNLRREIDRVFESFNIGAWRFPFGRQAMELDLPWPREGTWAITPAIDVSEKEKEYEITAELPGMDEKDIEVKLSNGTLMIKGEKKEHKEERDKDYFLSERRYGSFMRTFRVPEGIDTGKIGASFSKGVLTVTLPKTPEAHKNEKKIEVKGAA